MGPALTRLRPGNRSTAASAADWFLRGSTRPTWRAKGRATPSSASRASRTRRRAGGGVAPGCTTTTLSGSAPYSSTRSRRVDSETANTRRQRRSAQRVVRRRYQRSKERYASGKRSKARSWTTVNVRPGARYGTTCEGAKNRSGRRCQSSNGSRVCDHSRLPGSTVRSSPGMAGPGREA